MTREEIWNQHIQQFMDFMENHQRRPSKYVLEEHDMLNWYKYTRKKLASGKLSATQVEQFARLQALADRLQRKNQYAYTHSFEGDLWKDS